MRGCRQELVEAGIYRSDDDVERVAGALDRFLPGIETAAPDTAILGLKDSSKFEFRPLEIMNWLEQLVIPTKNSTKYTVNIHMTGQRLPCLSAKAWNNVQNPLRDSRLESELSHPYRRQGGLLCWF